MNTPEAFIATIMPLAIDEEQRSGIKPLITISQAAHESGWGNSQLTREANNLFGFTGDSWAAQGKPIIRLPTKEWFEPTKDKLDETVIIPGHWETIERPFRAYKSWAESVRDWASLIQRTRYAGAYIAAKAGDLETYAKEVQAEGYATDPKYSIALIKIGTLVKELFPQI